MTIRSLIAALLLSLGALSAHAQQALHSEVALNYTFVRTNAPPGGCGCFSMNGGSASYAYHLSPQFAVVADIGAVHAGNVDASGRDLTLTTFLVGPRFSHPLKHNHLSPYAQILLGAVHATGGIAPTNSISASTSAAFTATIGGGLDARLTPHISIRTVQVEYFLTTLLNGADNHQNNLRVNSGVVFSF
jgi:outer membrane immunogenic protein